MNLPKGIELQEGIYKYFIVNILYELYDVIKPELY